MQSRLTEETDPRIRSICSSRRSNFFPQLKEEGKGPTSNGTFPIRLPPLQQKKMLQKLNFTLLLKNSEQFKSTFQFILHSLGSCDEVRTFAPLLLSKPYSPPFSGQGTNKGRKRRRPIRPSLHSGRKPSPLLFSFTAL